MKKKYVDLEVELIKGDRGIFDVRWVPSNELLFSKYEVGRFPTVEEIVARLEDKMS